MHSLTFHDLTADQVRALTEYRERIETGQHVATPHHQTAPVPVAPVVPAGALAPVDTNGVPYNIEIHSTPAFIKNDGNWRARKGCKEAAEVWASQHASGSQPQGAPQTPFPAFGTPAAPVQPVATAQFGQYAPPPPVVDYQEFMRLSQALMNSGRLTPDAAMAMLAKVGITNPADLATNDTARSAIYAELAVM